MIRELFQSISEAIHEAIPGIAPEDLIYGVVPKPEMGDIALRTFEAAKRVGIAPSRLAARIVREASFGDEVREAVVAGPYVNFWVNRAAYARRVVEAIWCGGDRFGSHGIGVGKKALVEHTSINPNASPHVGRGRNALIGDSLVRLLRSEGYDVSVHYYVNDMGRQIGLLVLGVEDRLGSLTPATLGTLSFEELLDIYVDANARAERDAGFSARSYELLAKMEQGDPETRAKFRTVTELCLEHQLEILARLGAHYDVYDRESDFVQDPRLEEVVGRLQEKKSAFTDEEGRLVVDLAKLGYRQEEGRHFVLKRANGSSMYGYRDLAYTIYKMEQGRDLNLIVLGEDHKLYTQQTRLILEAVGESSPEPIYYSYILLKDDKMSTRRGKGVLLKDFLDEAVQRAAVKVEEQCEDLSAQERRAIAEQVAIGAVRFTILRVNPNRNVIFDWESSLSFTGDTGPYVQYSCARIASILRKFGPLPESVWEPFPTETDAEWNLCLKLAVFPEVVSLALSQRNCAPIAQYALETAKQFTTFYHDCPVLEAPTEPMRVARGQLCAATRQTLKNALGLLGIEALDRM